MEDARVSASRTARLIGAMEQFAVAYKRSGDSGTRAEAYAMWCEALRDLADAADVPMPDADAAMAVAAGG